MRRVGARPCRSSARRERVQPGPVPATPFVPTTIGMVDVGGRGTVAVAEVFLGDGDGRYFSFELARDGRTVRSLRPAAVHWTYHFTVLGLYYGCSAAQVRRWLARRDCYAVSTERAADDSVRFVARVPFEALLLTLDCTRLPAWSLS